ncbi:unnamed protein product, partial [Prunus brigantina]
ACSHNANSLPNPNETPTLCTSITDQNGNSNAKAKTAIHKWKLLDFTVKLDLQQAPTIRLFQPKLALNSSCLGRLFLGDDKEGDGEKFREGMT